ncbi:hypothetical protein E9531_06555 [Lampropedia puyangensis]|uniref:Uncharacterized protein n=1 Tax=Lampropedia puyangensis TaxID=1330072 RepID=A0A4S8F5Q2_9BURK|nr:hypothetical protein [Lampropedia puyangensis]THU02760.1 hypothetical protein E9531_06555 [Lampropedia puyangensis]
MDFYAIAKWAVASSNAKTIHVRSIVVSTNEVGDLSVVPNLLDQIPKEETESTSISYTVLRLMELRFSNATGYRPLYRGMAASEVFDKRALHSIYARTPHIRANGLH